MLRYDREFLDKTAERLNNLPDDRSPEWGSMRVPQMRAHLVTAVRYSLGKEPISPPEGSPVTRFLYRLLFTSPVAASGVFKLPKNVEKPKLYDSAAPEASVDELSAEMEEYLNKVNAKELAPPPHPSLGDLGVKGWNTLHVLHVDHHLRQFGA